MKMEAIVTQVRENHSVSKTTGAPVTYRDVFFADLSTDPLTRLNSEVVYRPNDAEFQAQPMKRGDRFTVCLLQPLEMRAGLLVGRFDVQPLKK